MSPKFRGGSDDWLDDENASSRTARKSNKAKRSARDSDVAEYLPTEQANGTVSEVFPQLCGVLGDDGAQRLCSYRRAAVLGAKGNDADQLGRDRSPVAVGDRVHVTATDSKSGIVDGLVQRRNSLSRPAPGRDGGALWHVLAANIDQIVVVASATRPEFSEGLVDRFLVTAEASGIASLILVTKIDLLETGAVRPWEVYSEIGYPVFEICAPRGLGVQAVRDALSGKTSVFCGHSGVGKTSLLNALLDARSGRVGDVSETGKGKHTTSSAVLVAADTQGTRTIDTPGIKELGIPGLSVAQVAAAFPEFRGLQCPVTGCLHLDEESCLARAMPRYASYRRIVESLSTAE